jgi:hypothetical protein
VDSANATTSLLFNFSPLASNNNISFVCQNGQQVLKLTLFVKGCPAVDHRQTAAEWSEK